MIDQRVASFMKVSKARLAQDMLGAEQDTVSQICETPWFLEMYNQLELPKRATTGSAGYDFHLPCKMAFEPGKAMTIPTGIRCKIADGWFLCVVPRSGLGFKYGLRLVNTVGVIDSDYFGAKNEGHIIIKMTCDQPFELNAGERFAQGILLPYGIAFRDYALIAKREGGFGSTSD